MRNWRNVLWWAGLAILLVAVLWFVPQLQGRHFSQGVPAKEVPALVNEYRRTWAQIIGGVGYDTKRVEAPDFLLSAFVLEGVMDSDR
jgi:hypothetical protein